MSRAEAIEQCFREAVARGWCTEENKHKEMDVVLVEAIYKEVIECYKELE